MKTFGLKDALEGVENVACPEGELCFYCDKSITSEACGFILPYHYVEKDEHRIREVAYHRMCLMQGMFGLKQEAHSGQQHQQKEHNDGQS